MELETGNTKVGGTGKTPVEYAPIPEELNKISAEIVDAALKIHRTLGPGLLESAYEGCLIHELQMRGLTVNAQVILPVFYEGIKLDMGYRIDMLVENQIILELKAIEEVLPIHKAQLLTYLRLSKLRLGLLINFNVRMIKDGITRLVR